MSLSSAISTAQSSLSNYSTQTSLLSRNISNASNPDYSRRSASLATSSAGAQVVSIQRAQDQILLEKTVSSTATASGQNALLDGLANLKDIMGGNDYESAPATLISSMRDTLATYAAKPGESTLAQTAVADATTVALGLRDASAAVQNVRLGADQEIGRQVHTLNELLSQFEEANTNVYRGTQLGKDVSADLDQRDSVLKKISEIIGVTSVTRSGNDVALYTNDGTTLFETVARPVTFEASPGFAAGIEGNAIYVDGVPLAAGQGATTTARGSLQGLMQIRDEYAPALQSQLDEIARALVVTFAEKDQSGGLPDQPGLFTWSGGTMPGGTMVPGIAATIKVNPALVPSAGGNPQLLRDGGINGAAYIANTTGAAGFTSQLDAYVVALGTPMTFDAAAGLDTSASVLDFAADSVGWLELNRSEASAASETREATRFRAVEAHSNATGVSLDEEMSMLLELEQSYKASARIISVVDEMLRSLLAAVG
ncbi:flagellar hook-associated protein FlgK [Hoeflea ulvae]|uniref:Flagellar hook-associated protein 1 n=1 Tax=Hoeflea ulvae TaxID=2983764 RepID=A0ABT3YCC3_9HYPH|nr:flagellar hook-associated protein FlgK [Hoeflea ulvae]MCY0093531.1 flagellar hook-associated protein FlgK [Hoeflea ulvae]